MNLNFTQIKITFCVFSFSLGAGLAGQALAAETPRLVPNDTFYDRQWAMDFIHAPEAWAQTNSGQGSVLSAQSSSTKEVVVAQIDGGMDFSHPDLKGALWTNPEETLNGKDDDDNGLVDDVHGWNYVTNSPDVRPIKSMMYLNGAFEHGTAVASLIAGRGNDNIGMAGMDWKAKIMPLVILDATGSGETSRLVVAIHYAVAHRADIINMSLEGDADDPAVKKAVQEATAQGVLVVIAAGNNGANLDDWPVYPTCYQGAANQSMLVVSALEETGARYVNSNFGKCVNIAAPGADMVGARPTYDETGNTKDVSGYGMWDGTSMAVPLVSGAAAMLKAQHPDWTGEQLASRILATVQPFRKGIDATGLGQGVLDAGAAVASAQASQYGPWQLLAANPGQIPLIRIIDESGKLIYSFYAGNQSDKRGLRVSFIHWDEDRWPDVLVTSQGDESGAWRVYRRDGVLLAAGQASQTSEDKIKGGLLLATQDLNALGREEALLTEASGQRAWRLDSVTGLGQAFWTTLDAKPMGSMAVGVERPEQVMLLMTRSLPYSTLAVVDAQGLGESSNVTTTNPGNMRMARGRTADGREVISMIQSGKPTYLIERNGMLDVTTEAIKVTRWMQAPLGLDVPSQQGYKFYDFWPR
ncbi:MAG: S8 family serine peptidase [Patescibacteria group bacterium]|jgi:subtilisin family serine protease